MIEWFALLLLVPAIVVPVVLLLGFAGCDKVFGLDRLPESVTFTSAVGKSATTITLTWSYAGSPAAKFQFERRKASDMTSEFFEAVSSPFDDQGLDNPGDTKRLEPATTYLYRVRPVLSDGEFGNWSNDNGPDVAGTTLSLVPAFGWTDQEQQLSRDLDFAMGKCLVQRIEPSRLSAPPNASLVRLHLRASSMATAAIESIYISRADPAPGKDPYDSDVDLTVVKVGTTPVPTNNAVILEVYYDLDPSQPLLIAMDFRPVSPSAIRVIDLPPDQAVAYVKDSASEAGTPDRSGFTGTPGVYFIERIEAG